MDATFAFAGASPIPQVQPSIRNRAQCVAQPSMALPNRMYQRARDDIEKLQEFCSSAGKAAASTAAALLIALSSISPVLADVPDVAPKAALFDDANVVIKGNEALFEKAMTAIKKNEGYTVRFVMAKNLPYGFTPSDYAEQLSSEWALGPKDVLFVASPKLARAGAYVGTEASERLTASIVDSLCNETYALKAGVESYGGALLDLSNRLIPVLSGKEDPGPPDLRAREVVQTYKTKSETSKDRQKYIIVVGTVLVIAFVAPLVQTYWYVKDD